MKFLLKTNLLQVWSFLPSLLLHNFIGKAFLIGLCFFSFSSIEAKIAKVHQDELRQERAQKRFIRKQKSSERLQIPLSDKRKEEELEARGIIIKFHRWPNAKLQKEIIKKLKAKGLKKTKTIKRFKVWMFDWEDIAKNPSTLKLRSVKEALSACKDLPKLSILKYCESNTKVYPASTNDSDTQTEANAGCMDKECLRSADSQELSVLSEMINENNPTQETCELIPSKHKLMNSTLSDYWAQELIGADLLREELEKVPPPEKKNYIAVFDTREGNHAQNDLDSHAVGVKNLISDEGMHAVLPELKNQISIFDLAFNGGYQEIADSLLENSEVPSFINNSMNWRSKEGVYDAFDSLSPPAIVVISSDNDFSDPLDKIKSKASKDFNAIVVGSLSPEGFVSNFSQSGEEVHILAPSDDYITSAKEDGSYSIFGGTSGAAPLVTGSLAGFEWLSDYHPTAEEAKLLLERTALPTLNSHENPQINGVGLLNAYKLGMVGKRLKEKCQNKDPSCFQEEINNEENYHFDVDQNLQGELTRVFPSCASGEKSSNFSEGLNCEEKRKTFTRLRKAFFLSPEENKNLLKSLSCIYKERGFSQNVEALDRLALALESTEDVKAFVRVSMDEEEPISPEIIRLMLGMRGFEEEFNRHSELEKKLKSIPFGKYAELPLLKEALHIGNLDLKKKAVWAASDIGELGLPLVEQAFNTGNLDLQKIAVRAAGRMGELGLPLVEQAFNTGNLDLQEEAVWAAGEIGELGLPLVEQAFNTGNLDLQKTAVWAAGAIGELGLPLVEQAFNTGNLDLQKKAVWAASWIGELGLPLVEQAFNTGNLDLQKTALNVASKMGEPALPLLKQILKQMLEDDNLYPEYDRETIENQIKKLEY